ncbi:thymidylate kinase [Armillaria nabsnona]|nr:thymidylate kinase [Armillaria nabsnona]
MARGAFIVIEGLDPEKRPRQTTSIGKMIDSYLQSKSELDGHAIHLLFSANRWELASTIEDLLESGTTVLCDQYAFSGIAFSASKACLTSAPDLVFLDVTPEKARQRGEYGNERYEKEEMQRGVREQYTRIESENVVQWATINAGREREQVAADIWTRVEPLVDAHPTALAASSGLPIEPRGALTADTVGAVGVTAGVGEGLV